MMSRHWHIFAFPSSADVVAMSRPRMKISVSTDISVLGFYGYIGYIGYIEDISDISKIYR